MNEQARHIEDRLDTLAAGMRRVSQGNFDTKLERCDEEPFGSIFDDFNSMTASLLGIEALRESFVSNVAHEFKTPLSYIQGYATLLQDDDLTADERRDYVNHINNATRRLSDMIGNLLEISNLSRPGTQPEKSPFSLDEQLRHVIAVLLPQMTRKGISYDVALMSTEVNGNESLLEDAWTNLISNAVKYTPAGGTISVSLVHEKDQVKVSIQDTGCGMTQNQIEHAFDRFYQGEDSHTGEGNGLGLSIVKAVVKKHEGTVQVESELGKGTTFTVLLPA